MLVDGAKTAHVTPWLILPDPETVAVNCCVPPIVIVAGFGETATEVMEGDVGGVGGVVEVPPPPQAASSSKRLLPVGTAVFKTHLVIVQSPIRIFNFRRGVSRRPLFSFNSSYRTGQWRE